jgi:4-amino-4-deoxy-L-arabinose transferase-like glycosyltransferase
LAEKEITLEIKNPALIALLIFCGVILFLELQVTFSTPISFGDEGIQTGIAQYIGKEKEYPVFDVWENTKLNYGGNVRPLLFNILEGSLFFIFGVNNDMPIRILTPFISVLTGIVVFLLSKRLYNEKVGFVAAILAITIPSIVTYSVTFYTDVLYTFFATLFFLLFLLAIKEKNRKYLILSGIFGGLAFLTDLSGLAIYIFIFLAILYGVIKKKLRLGLIKEYSILILLLILIPSAFLLRNLYYFNNPLCNGGIPILNKIWSIEKCSVNNFESKYQFSGRVEQTGTEQNVYTIGITNYLNFAYGNLWLVILGFFVGLIILLTKRNKTSDLMIIYFIVFLGLFYISTGRAEDTARNTLGWVPIIALVSAIFFGEAYDFIKKYQKYIALIVFIVVIWFGYQNFKEKLDTMVSVKRFSPTFFEACNWIKANTPQNSTLYTVWAHRAVYNCQRTAVATSRIPDISLSRDVDYTVDVTKQNGITYIFAQKFSIDYQDRHLSENYDWSYIQFLENNTEHFKKVYENGPSLDQCLQAGGCDGNIVYQIV